jgi:arginine utilization regulatory protein
MDRTNRQQKISGTRPDLPSNQSSEPTLPEDIAPLPAKSLSETQAKQERQALLEVLTSTGGNISKSSKIIGISRQLLHYKMKKHHLKREQFLPK